MTRIDDSQHLLFTHGGLAFRPSVARLNVRLNVMVVLAQPEAYSAWDPLLQRFIVQSSASLHASRSTPHIAPANRLGSEDVTPPPRNLHQEAAMMLPPPPRQATATPAAPATHVTPGAPVTQPSPEAPQTPAELEASSLALAWRLQQEEQAEFMRAMTPVRTPGAPEAPEQMETDDDSLQLAIRLQQEELQWQALQTRQSYLAAMGGSEESLAHLDEETRAMLEAEAAGAEGRTDHQ